MLRRRELLVGVGLAWAAPGCLGPPPPSAPSPLFSSPLPDFSRKTLAGATVDTARARGRIVVVEFFAKSCEPCRRSLPALEALHRADPEVLVVGVGEDEGEDEVREVVEAHRLTFDVVHDRDHVLSGRFRVRALPMTFVADAAGVTRWVGDTETTRDALARVLGAVRRAQG